MVHLMAVANATNAVMLNTSNLSEDAVGYVTIYVTIYGDNAGAIAPLGGVLKTQVYRIAEWRNAAAERDGQVPPIPPDTIAKPPSAELAPGQVDSNTVPPYPVLDEILVRYVQRRQPVRPDRRGDVRRRLGPGWPGVPGGDRAAGPADG
jgi:NAD+ synthase (glutamine-hydrolysing)